MHLSIPKTLSSKPWLLVVLLFGSFLLGWAAFLTIAIRNAPQRVEMVTHPPHAGH